MAKIAICYTVPGTFGFAKETIAKLKEVGHELYLVSSNENDLKQMAIELGVNYKYIGFKRSMNLILDLKTIYSLVIYFIKLKPDIVIGATPKAGLLSMIAGKVTRVPTRVYHIFGFPFETTKGLLRMFLINIERVTSGCATCVLPISHSIGEVAISEKIVRQNKIIITNALTIGGVDTTIFNPAVVDASKLKEKYKCNDDEIIIGFIGRLTKDKGLYDYMEVINKLSVKYNNLRCLIIGGNDDRCPIDKELFDKFVIDHNAIYINRTNDVPSYMALMDVFLQPSYREGFGNANVEAESMEVPVVCYDVTGCKDSISNGLSGFCVPFGNIDRLCSAMVKLIENVDLRKRMGIEGRKFVEDNYSREKVACFNRDYFASLLK